MVIKPSASNDNLHGFRFPLIVLSPSLSSSITATRMPTLKRLFSEPLVLNQNYMRSVTGILKCSHCVSMIDNQIVQTYLVTMFFKFFTLVSTISLFYACRTIYDPYLGTFTGFSGGDIETTCLLFYFSTFFFSMFMIATYYFSIVAATIMSKTCYVSSMLLSPSHKTEKFVYRNSSMIF